MQTICNGHNLDWDGLDFPVDVWSRVLSAFANKKKVWSPQIKCAVWSRQTREVHDGDDVGSVPSTLCSAVCKRAEERGLETRQGRPRTVVHNWVARWYCQGPLQSDQVIVGRRGSACRWCIDSEGANISRAHSFSFFSFLPLQKKAGTQTSE